MYVMPNNALYWYGYSNNFEDCSTANGWTKFSSFTMATPVHDTREISISTTSSTGGGVGSSTPVVGTTVKVIVTSISLGTNAHICIGDASDKSLGNHVTDGTDVGSSTGLKSHTIVNAGGYVSIQCYRQAQWKISAFWLE